MGISANEASFPVESDVAELPLLLPRWQVDALQTEAQEQGMSVGQFLRKLISHALPQERALTSVDGYWY